MISYEYSEEITLLKERVEKLERQASEKSLKLNINDQDWDNQTLMDQWGVSLRTTANFREQGLGYYKRGGRVFYTPEQRESFKKKSKS